MKVVAVGPISPALSFANGGPGLWSTGVWGPLALSPGGGCGAGICPLWPHAEGAPGPGRAALCLLGGSQTAAKQMTQLSLGEQSSPFPTPKLSHKAQTLHPSPLLCTMTSLDPLQQLTP